MKETIQLTAHFQVSPSEIFHAWLDSKKHSEMTGGTAECSNKEGETFSAWDGYITGKNKSLVLNKEIIQDWRTTEFKDSDEDSELIIRLTPKDGGCELTLTHNNIPKGQPDYKKGWVEHYFEPMTEYFENK